MTLEINEDIARKVLQTVDVGLVGGMGDPVPGKMCVEAAVCYAMGLPHHDNPPCVARSLRALKIAVNDSAWPNNNWRARGLRRLAVAQLGSKDNLDEIEFPKRITHLVIQKIVPLYFRNSHPTSRDLLSSEIEQFMLELATICETIDHYDIDVYKAILSEFFGRIIEMISINFYKHNFDRSFLHEIKNLIQYFLENFRYHNELDYSGYNAIIVGNMSSNYPLIDGKTLLETFCEDVVQILIDMKAPGCQWLYLTEEIKL